MAVWETLSPQVGRLPDKKPPQICLTRHALHYGWMVPLTETILSQCINWVWTQITWNSLSTAVENRMNSIGHENNSNSAAFLSWITALSLSFSHALLAPPRHLWNLTAVLIPKILLQGLISFPFLERLFKYCYIYSQQPRSLPASQAAVLHSLMFFPYNFQYFCSFVFHVAWVSVLSCVQFTYIFVWACSCQQLPVEHVDDISRTPFLLLFLTVACFCEYEHTRDLVCPRTHTHTKHKCSCVIVLISASRRTARDPHGTTL